MTVVALVALVAGDVDGVVALLVIQFVVALVSLFLLHVSFCVLLLVC